VGLVGISPQVSFYWILIVLAGCCSADFLVFIFRAHGAFIFLLLGFLSVRICPRMEGRYGRFILPLLRDFGNQLKNLGWKERESYILQFIVVLLFRLDFHQHPPKFFRIPLPPYHTPPQSDQYSHSAAFTYSAASLSHYDSLTTASYYTVNFYHSCYSQFIFLF